MIRSAGIYFTARVIAALCGLLAVAVYTRLATPEVYGVFSLVMTVAMALFAVCFHWLQSAVGRFLPAEDGRHPASLGAALFGFGLASLLVVLAGVAMLVLDPFAVGPTLVALGAGVALAHAALEITLSLLHARQKASLYALLLASRALGGLVLGTLLLLAGHGAAGLLAGLLIAHAVPVAVLGWRWRRRLAGLKVEPVALRRMAAFGLPLGLVGIAVSVIGITDRYMLALLVGIDAAGSYAAPYDLAQRSLQIVMLSAFLAASPAVFRAFEQDNEKLMRRHLVQQARLILLTTLPVATVMAAAAPLLARLLFGEAFREPAAMLIPWIVAATVVQGLQSYYYSYCFTLARRTLLNAAIVAAGAVLNVGLNIVLIPSFGALGAACATLACVILILGLTLLVSRSWVVLPWPTRDMVKIAAVCLVAAPLIALAARVAGLLPALLLTGLAGLLLLALLLATNAGRSRSVATELLMALRRQLGGRLVIQP